MESIMLMVFVLFYTLFVSCHPSHAYIGVNYGRIADNLPPPTTAVSLVQSISATQVKIYDADSQVLEAFANTNIELVLTVGNNLLVDFATNPQNALNWVTSNVQAYLPATKITGIIVGNEVLVQNNPSWSDALVLAMESVYKALVQLNLDKQVIVTSAHALNVLEASYPPSICRFRSDMRSNMNKILKFHSQTGSPVFLNVYPFFAYKGDPVNVHLDFALLKPSAGIVDPNTNLHYDNLLYMQIDAFYAAIDSLGYKELVVHISETGWPSKGDDHEPGATPENAQTYNQNVMKLAAEQRGTPMKPNAGLNVIIFALFNEDQKSGSTSERNFGLFRPDGTSVYNVAPVAQTRPTTAATDPSTQGPVILFTDSSPYAIDGLKAGLFFALVVWLLL